MVKRRINVLERSITSTMNGNRWSGYASYNPKWSVMLLEILRVYNNYVIIDSNKLKNKGINHPPRNPAQKLGIATKTYSIRDIFIFSSANEVIQSKKNISDI